METQMEVRLLEHTPDPLKSIYVAFRGDYSHKPFHVIWDEVEREQVPREEMIEFAERRLEVRHVSPLYQVHFKFSVSGVSRAFTHQLVRHHIGIDFEQQSLRYVKFRGGDFPFVIPESIKNIGKEQNFLEVMQLIGRLYEELIQADVPAEDARFVIPQAVGSNITFTVNLAELLHIGDERLCMRAQWEFRHVVAKMRTLVLRVEPLLGRFIQPKCGERRLGYCNEDLTAWQKCPIGKSRPHMSQIKGLIEAVKRGEELPVIQPTRELKEEDFEEVIGKSIDYLE